MLLKVKKSSAIFQLETISKTAIIVSIFGNSRIFTISQIITHFSVDTMCVNRREVTVVESLIKFLESSLFWIDYIHHHTNDNSKKILFKHYNLIQQFSFLFECVYISYVIQRLVGLIVLIQI